MEFKKSLDKSSFASYSTLFGSSDNFSYADDEAGHAMSRHQSYEHHIQIQQFCYLDDMYLDIMSPPFQSCEDEIRRIIGVESKDAELIEPKRSRADVSPSEPFEVLRKYGRNPPLSFEKIIKLAAELVQFQSVSEGRNELSFLNHQFSSSILILSDEDSKEVRLVQNLISCAEKVAAKQYECAVQFLKECDEMSSATGTPVQRLAFYVSEALFEKIAKGTGKWENPTRKVMNSFEPARLVNSMPTYFKKFPVTQITNLVGSHTILRYLEGARKIHIIDLEIRSGVQWVQLMQDVAARRGHPVHHLKITAVGTQSESILVETGKQLADFAESVNLKFTFKIVMVEDILDLNLDLFNLNADESVAVNAVYTLLTMIGRADRLDHLMGVIRDLSPCVMVVTEMEANCNSPHYAERFLESLFLFGAFFDSLSDCMKDHETSRMDIESTLFRSSIKNVLAAEGEEMVLRHTPINVWRDIFAGFGLVETEISFTSLKQANLLLQHSITLCRNGRCVTVGWKGKALTSLSAWKVKKH